MSALYVHIPFCEKKCFYCSFAVSIGQKQRFDKYLTSLKKESAKFNSVSLDTIYIGGGTPTLLEIQHLDFLFKFIYENFDAKNVKEITVEANPEGLTKAKLDVLKANKVSRISLGVQTFDGEQLKSLGRAHGVDEIYSAYELIRNAGFDNVNLDLIFGLPDQSLLELKEDLKHICALDSEHLSIYALTVDPKSRFFTKGVALQTSDEQIAKYELIISELKRNKFDQYEVSNFAKAGFESLHNIKYWECRDYIGLGMGAHSFVNGKRWSNSEKLTEYISMIKNNAEAIVEAEEITVAQQLTEALVFGLRMNRGVNIDALQTRYQQPLPDEKREKIYYLMDHGLLMKKDECIVVTEQGRLVLDTISAQLI